MPVQNGGMPHLLVLAPDSDRGRRIPLNRDYLVVGREPTCDVRFDDPCVSRTHAALRRHGNAVYVEDLGSSAGTFVNGDILCQPSGTMIWNYLIVWLREGQAAGAVIAARARLRLAMWIVSS